MIAILVAPNRDLAFRLKRNHKREASAKSNHDPNQKSRFPAGMEPQKGNQRWKQNPWLETALQGDQPTFRAQH
jgi:hypothetical protein